MMKLLCLSFVIFLCGCGSHRSESSGFSTGGEIQRVEKPVTPSEIMLDATRAGDVERIKDLLAQGFPIDELLSGGRTALIEAVIWNRPGLVEYLIAQGARADIPDAEGRTALQHAEGHPALLRLLQPRGSEEIEALFLAVQENRYNDVKRMLSEGVDGNVENTEGETPLTLSVKMNLELVVRVLVQPAAGIDVNKRNRGGESPLGLSLSLKLPRIEKMLRQRGANEN